MTYSQRLYNQNYLGICRTASIHDFHSCLFSGTYGTGAFILINTGVYPVPSSTGLLTTPCYQLGPNAPVFYALEGSIAIAGAGISWLKDNLGAIKDPEDTEVNH